MRRISIDFLEPGMENGQPIYGPNGKVLLGRGVKFSEPYILRLKQLGITSVYIVDEIVDDVVVPDVIGEDLRRETVNQMQKAYSSIALERRLNTKNLSNLVADIMDGVLGNPKVLAQMTDIRSHDDFIFLHSVNVCVLAMMIGRSMSMSPAQLRDLGTGALLHDVGWTKLPREILEKDERLTVDETQVMQRHTTYGFDILRDYFELSLLSSHIAYQHHERYDGSGYPRGLRENGIHEFARVTAVVDVYDTMLSKRRYRGAYSLFDTLEELRLGTGKLYDPDVVYALFKNVAIYPVGSLVELSTGDIAMVVRTDQDSQYQPVVRRLIDSQGRRIEREKELDLREFNRLKIVKLLEDERIYKRIREIFTKGV
ncbi:MAG: HD-GYP domain-containing protein [Firmicutes bacterium]|nr:HD-GYP domain-containing protein [Bacillota bacterium]